jgi:hypothetical protein
LTIRPRRKSSLNAVAKQNKRHSIPSRAKELHPVGEITAPRDLPSPWAIGLCLVWGWLLFLPSLSHLGSEYIGSTSTDMARQYRHYFAFFLRSIDQGIWPSWNPFNFCGTPFLPGTGCAAYDPFSFLLYLFGAPLGVNLSLLFHGMVLSAGMFFWSRLRGCSNIASLLASIAATGSTVFLSRFYAGHYTIATTLAWAPLVFAAQEIVFRRGLSAAPILGLAGALMFSGGHSQYVYYAALLLSLGVAVRFILLPSTQRGGWIIRTLGAHALAAIIAAGLSAVELLPLLDTVRFSARRAIETPGWMRFFSLPPENLLTLFAPNLFGNPENYWGRWFWWETSLYIGLIPLLLAIAGLRSRFRRPALDPIPVLVIGALFLAIAGYIPIISQLIAWIPGWALFRGHAKIAAFALLMLSVLAAHGLDEVRKNPSASPARTALKSALTLMVVLFLGNVLVNIDRFAFSSHAMAAWLSLPTQAAERLNLLPLDTTAKIVRQATLESDRVSVALGIALLLSGLAAGLFHLSASTSLARKTQFAIPCLAALELIFLSWSSLNVSFAPDHAMPPAGVQARFRELSQKGRMEFVPGGFINAGMSMAVPMVGGNDVNVPRFYNTYVNALFGTPDGTPNLDVSVRDNTPLLDAAALKFIVMPNRAQAAAIPDMTLFETTPEINIYERTSALPPASVVSRARNIGNTEKEILAALKQPVNFQHEVLLSGAPPQPIESTAPAESATPAPIEHPGTNEIQVTAPRPGWLVLANSYYPHWKATSDNQAVPLYRANGAFMAVKADRANQQFVFRYHNPFVTAGRWISLVSALTLIVAGLWYWFLRRRKAQLTPTPPHAPN